MVLRFIQKCPRCAGIGVAERKSESADKSLYSFICQDCGFVTDREEARTLFEDARSLYIKGYGEKCSGEEILIEKEKWNKAVKEAKIAEREKAKLERQVAYLLNSNADLRKNLRKAIDALSYYAFGNEESKVARDVLKELKM